MLSVIGLHSLTIWLVPQMYYSCIVLIFYSGDEDIYFNSITSPRKPRSVPRTGGAEGSNSTSNAADAVPLPYDFTELDRCLCSESQSENDQAYERLDRLSVEV